MVAKFSKTLYDERMRRLFVVLMAISFFLLLPLPAKAADELCCPAGYSNACPFFTNRNTTCCKHNGFFSYDTTPKIVCTAAPPEELNLCCPQEFRSGSSDCPFGVNIAKQCCNRTGFGKYEIADKVQCGTENADNTNPINSAPKYCAQWVDPKTGKDVPATSPLVTSSKAQCKSISTAVGNISTEPQSFVKSIFSVVLGLAGGIALILIMVAGYRFMASQGNPEQVQAARDQLISAIVGLLFIIFSFVILQVIGVDILKIPGFQPN